MAHEVSLCTLGYTTSAPGDQDVLRESGVGVLDLDVGELDATLVEVLDQVGQLTLYKPLAGIRRDPTRKATGGKELLRTSGALDFQDALFGSGILECVKERGLGREEGPMAVGRRAGAGDGGIDDALVAALDRRPVRGEIEGRHF